MFFSRYAAARLLAATSLIAVVAAAPQSIAPQKSAPREVSATASIAGVVRAAKTAAPVARARVTIVSDAIGTPRVTIAGADGRYLFENLPAGAYTVHGAASGFASRFHGQRPTGKPARVRVGAAQRLTDIDVELPAAGVIVGRIVDEDQRPFVGATVDALVSRTEGGQATLVSVANAVTDDRGAFRLAGLAEGQYYVSAFDPAFADVGNETGRLRYTATYYPGVVFVEDARHVSVAPGGEPKDPIVFPLKIVAPARVSGVLATHDRKQLVSGAVIMSPVQGDNLTAVPSEDVRIDPDGTFSFRNVPPGRYQIRARAETEPKGVALFATYRIVVNGRDMTNVELELQPGALVEGTVRYDATRARPPRGFPGLRVRAPFVDGSTFGDALTGDVGADGRFRIRGVMSGRHYITVEGLAHPWVLKDVHWRGQDITDVAIDVEARQRLDDVRITLTDVANEVSGEVTDGGKPVPDALVLIAPVSSEFWNRASRRFAVTRTDDAGRYHVRGLPAGVYRATASIELDESDVHRREFLDALVDTGAPLTLAEPRAHDLDLELTFLSRMKRGPGY